jgi:hypothetical protein
MNWALTTTWGLPAIWGLTKNREMGIDDEMGMNWNISVSDTNQIAIKPSQTASIVNETRKLQS